MVITTAQLDSTKSELMCKLKTCTWRVRDSQWLGSLKKIPAGNKAKSLSSVNQSAKTTHYHHHGTKTNTNVKLTGKTQKTRRDNMKTKKSESSYLSNILFKLYAFFLFTIYFLLWVPLKCLITYSWVEYKWLKPITNKIYFGVLLAAHW